MDLRTGMAFWPIRNGLLAAYPPLERTESCEVAVVGAGITGALVAERGIHGSAAVRTDTTLTELAAHVGVERAVRSWRLGIEAIDELEALSTKVACDFARRPSVYLASSRSDTRELRAEYELRARHGFEVAWQWHHLQRDCRYAGTRLVDGPAQPRCGRVRVRSIGVRRSWISARRA